MKAKKQNFYYIFSLLILISSCKKWKYETNNLTVVVWDFFGNKPIEGATVFLKERKEGTSWGYNPSASPFVCKKIDTGKTGKDGVYVFSKIDMRKKDDYAYGTGCGEAYGKYLGDGSSCFDGSGFSKTLPLPDTIKLPFYAKLLQIRFSPPPPYTLGDTLIVNFLNKIPYSGIQHSVGATSYNDPNGKHDVGELPNGTYDVKITRIKGGVKTISTDVLTLEVDETKEYVVNF